MDGLDLVGMLFFFLTCFPFTTHSAAGLNAFLSPPLPDGKHLEREAASALLGFLTLDKILSMHEEVEAYRRDEQLHVLSKVL